MTNSNWQTPIQIQTEQGRKIYAETLVHHSSTNTTANLTHGCTEQALQIREYVLWTYGHLVSHLPPLKAQNAPFGDARQRRPPLPVPGEAHPPAERHGRRYKIGLGLGFRLGPGLIGRAWAGWILLTRLGRHLCIHWVGLLVCVMWSTELASSNNLMV